MSAALGVLLSGVSGSRVPDWLAARIRDGLAGVVLFAQNTPDLPATRRLTDQLRSERADLVICVDEEGGDVTRLQAATGSSLPGAAAFGELDDPDLTRRSAQLLGGLLAQAGIDLDLAPVLDVASQPDNPVIGVRSFGADPDLVTRHGRAYAEGLAAAGVASCGKHYPGHGDTRTDSHLGPAVVAATPDLLARRDEAPFAASGVDSVMTAHVVVPALGDEPASLSAWSTQRLRAAGFTGPVITDALGMAAISDRYPLGEACVRALIAGADLLCLDAPQNREPQAALLEAERAIDQAVAAGRLSAAALAESARRNRVLHRPAVAYSPMAVRAITAELEELGLQVARLALRRRGDPVLSRDPARALDPVVVDLRRRHNLAAGDTGRPLAEALRQVWPGVRIESAAILDSADAIRPDAPLLVLTGGADPAEAEALAALCERHPDPVVLHTGVAAAAPAGVRLICSHGTARPNARAAVEALLATPMTVSPPTPATKDRR